MYKSTTILLALIVVSCSNFTPNGNVNLTANTIDFDYSPDQRFLAILTNGTTNTLTILNSYDLSPVGEAITSTNGIFESFAFSSDSRVLAIGTNNGTVEFYTYDGKKFASSSNFTNSGTQSNVTSICFLSGNEGVVIGYRSNLINVVTISDNKVIPFTFVETPKSFETVTCSPKDSTIFAATTHESTNYQLSVFKITDKIDESFSKSPPVTGSSFLDAVFSNDGTKIFVIGSESIIYSINANDKSADITPLSKKEDTQSQPLNKIRVSNNNGIFAVSSTSATATKQIFILTKLEVTNLQSLKVSEPFTSTISSVALSGAGGHVFYASGANLGTDLGQCEKGEYPDAVSGECTECEFKCLNCWVTANNCFLCERGFYKNENQDCKECQVGCNACTDGSSCDECNTTGTHRINSSECDCVDDYFDANKTICDECLEDCRLCSSKTGCNECHNNLVFIGGKCDCEGSTYKKDSKCEDCTPHCLKCVDGESCESCVADGHWVLNEDKSKCVCDDKKGFSEQGGVCKCMVGFYALGEECVKCQPECTECLGIDNCQACVPPLSIKEGTTICGCKVNQYEDNVTVTCVDCNTLNTYCTECLSADTCTKCSDENRDEKKLCEECKAGKYKEEEECLDCNIDYCDECSNNVTCTHCVEDTNRWPVNGECVCKDGYLQQNLTCVKCDIEFCLFCTELEECSRCSGGRVPENNHTCVCDDAANLTENSNKKCECKDGFYNNATGVDNFNCKECKIIPNCKSCSSGTTCTACTSEIFKVSSGNCVCTNTKQYVSETQCKDCPEGCLTCENEEKCTSCDEGYDQDGDYCHKNGISALVIVLIVVGVIVLAGAVFVIIKYIKKRRAGATSADDYEEL